MRRAAAVWVSVLGVGWLYRLLARGDLTIDTGIGRRVRQLGPVDFEIAAPREVVFDVIAAPYLERTPRALAGELEVLERGTDMVLAAHFTEVRCGTTTTVETVRFDRPGRVDFRVVRGPVPHVVESFLLEPGERGTRLTWQGELGTDFWSPGAWWGERVARQWDRAVRRSLVAITTEAERRARRAAE
jgi:Polyketide cyclase / dehydrase and lipid transport